MPIRFGKAIGMPTRNVALTNHQASFVERLVSTGSLGQQAEQDFVEILQWTTRTFGEGQGSEVDVLRLLDERMDLPQHWPAANDHSP